MTIRQHNHTSARQAPAARTDCFMNHNTPSLRKHFAPLLARREAELRSVLETVQHGELADEQAISGEVQDFKDMAYREAQSDMAEMDATRAAQELSQVLAARRRLIDGSFGSCVQCGNEIDRRRLDALPATPLCVDCQTASEQAPPAKRQHG